LMMCAVSLGAAAQLPNSNSEIPMGLQGDVVCWFPLENHFEDISSNSIATSASESGLAFEAETSASFPFQSYLSFSGGVIALGSPPDLGREDDGGPHAYVYGYAGADVAQAINSTYYDDFGALYNFEAVSEWLLCPIGWHVPAADEWDMLTTTFGSGVGQKLKQNPPLWDGTNELGFNAIKVPVRSNGPGWNLIDHYSDFWTSSEKDANNAWGRELNTGSNNIEVDDNGKRAGCPVRCIKDAE